MGGTRTRLGVQILIPVFIAAVAASCAFCSETPRAQTSPSRQPAVDGRITDLSVREAPLGAVLKQLSAQSGMRIRCVTDENINGDFAHAPVGTMTLAVCTFTFHLSHCSLADALDAVLSMANEEQQWAFLQRTQSPDGSIVIWDARKQPTVTREFDVGDLLVEDEPFAGLRAGAETLALEGATARKQLLQIVQTRVQPNYWDDFYQVGWHLEWADTRLRVTAPPPQCDEVGELIEALRGRGLRAGVWPIYQVLERPVRSIKLNNASLGEAMDALSRATGVVVAGNEWGERPEHRAYDLDLDGCTLRYALERLAAPQGGGYQACDYRAAKRSVLIGTSNLTEHMIRWCCYDLRPVVRAWNRELTQYARENMSGSSQFNALADCVRQAGRLYVHDLDVDQIFAGRGVVRCSCREQVRIAALLELLMRSRIPDHAHEWSGLDGLTYVESQWLETRMYDFGDVTDHFLQQYPDAKVLETLTAAENAIGHEINPIRGSTRVCRLGTWVLLTEAPATHARVAALLARWRANPASAARELSP